MRKKNTFLSLCHVTPRKKNGGQKLSSNRTRLSVHRGDFSWRGVKKTRYKSEGSDWMGIVRQTLIGERGESTKFHVRYFEIAPNGHSSYEVHRHEHVVIGVRGKGICLAGNKTYRIGYLDIVYIRPNEPHQLRNHSEEPFGFLCIVNAKRDKPKVLTMGRNRTGRRNRKDHSLTT